MYKKLKKYQNAGFLKEERDNTYVAPEYAFPVSYGSLSNDGERDESEFSQALSSLGDIDFNDLSTNIFGAPPSTIQEMMALTDDQNLGNTELKLEQRTDKSLTRGAINILKALGKGVVSNPLGAFVAENLEAVINDEEPYWYYRMLQDSWGIGDKDPIMMNYGSELGKAQEGDFEDEPLYQSLQNYMQDPERAKLVSENPLLPAAEQYMYNQLTTRDLSKANVNEDGIPINVDSIENDNTQRLQELSDYTMDANELALIMRGSQKNLQKSGFSPDKAKTFKEYGQNALRFLGNVGKGARNVFARNPLGLLVANTMGEAYDLTQGKTIEPPIWMQMMTQDPFYGIDENQVYAYGDEVVDAVTQQKKPNIKNIYEGDDRFTISKMQKEQNKTDNLFNEQQNYLYNESGFFNPNLDLSKAPLANKKYTLYNPTDQEMFYDPMNPTKLFNEEDYKSYQNDITSTRTMAMLNQRAEMYPELFQKVTGFDPNTKEITYAGDQLEGDLFSDANPDSTYLQYTTPEGEESGSFTGSLVSDAEGDITGPIMDPFDQYENDEGQYTFMEAEAKYGGIPKYQRAGSIRRLVNWFKGADNVADVATTATKSDVANNQFLENFLTKNDNMGSYNTMIDRRFKMDLKSPLTREAITNYKTKFPNNYGASEEIGGGLSGLFDDITKRSNLLDDYITKNPSYATKADDFKYLGNMDGRQIVSVDTPVGTQYFYKSSGLAGKQGSKDMWIPFEGHADDTSKFFGTGSDDWFMKQGSVGNYKGEIIRTSPDGKIGVRQKLINMGVDPMEALKSGDLVLDQPGWDFMYTTNPNAFYNKLSNQLDRITKEKDWGVLDKTTRAHGGPHTEDEWEEFRKNKRSVHNDYISDESVNSEFNYYDSIAPGSYDPSVMDNMYFADQFEEKIEEDPNDEFEFTNPNKPNMVGDEPRKPRDFNFKPFEALVTGLGAVNQILENRPKDNSVNQLAGNQFTADTRDNRGFYDVNTGILNPDRNIVERQAAYGGRTDQLRNREYDDVDTTIELDEGTIQELIAAGAEIEIL